MPFRKRASSVLDGDGVEDSAAESDITALDDVLARAEEAEAEAAEAEALASAARARARALRLRREAQAAAGAGAAGTPAAEGAEAPVGGEATDAAEATEAAHATEADAEDIEVAEAAEEPAASSRRWIRRVRWRAIGLGAAAVATIALLTVSVLMVFHHRAAQAEHQRATEFAAAARQGVVTLMSLNFNTAKDDVQRIIDNAAGDFKKDFEASSQDFTTVAERSKVITEANVNATAVQSMTDNSAVVLVAATSRITNETGAKQDPRTWRLIVDVVRDGDRIKLSKVEFAP